MTEEPQMPDSRADEQSRVVHSPTGERRIADPPLHLGLDTDIESDRRASTERPRWLTMIIIAIAILVVVGFVLLHLTGAIGPGLHGGS